MSATVRDLALSAKQAARLLAPLDEPARNRALEAMASALAAAREELLRANTEDRQTAASMLADGELSAAAVSRLTLDAAKLAEMVAGIRSVAALPDPLGRVLEATELDAADPAPTSPAKAETPGSAVTAGLHLTKISVPIGVLAVIFEARPDAVAQIASLAIKSGNAAILKPGREVERTAAALVAVLRRALARAGLPEDALALVQGREQAAALLAMHDLVDLVIPRGSRALVEYVQANTRIPVLGHAEGVCHIYVDRDADPELALRVIDDAKTDYAAACNAVETVLVHRDIAPTFLPLLQNRLQQRNVRLHASADARTLMPVSTAMVVGDVADWHTEYGDLALSLGVVDSVDAAIAHIHRHGSAHTESILTENEATAERFLREVDAAGVFHNASTRFADGFRYGFGAEVGVSTSKFHARGPVGLEGLTTYKYLLRGKGHIAGDYRGANARSFTHRRQAAGSR